MESPPPSRAGLFDLLGGLRGVNCSGTESEVRGRSREMGPTGHAESRTTGSGAGSGGPCLASSLVHRESEGATRVRGARGETKGTTTTGVN